MARTLIQNDLETLAANCGHTAPELARDNTEALYSLAAFLRACNVGVFSALTMLMKLAVERGSSRDGRDSWPVETLSAALRSAYDVDWSRHRFWFALLEIAGMRLHTMSLDSPEIAYYEQQQESDQEILKGAPEFERHHYENLKAEWQQIHGELDQLLLHRENALMQREATRQAFMRRFPLHLEEQEQRVRLALAEFKLGALQENPMLTREELDELANTELAQANVRLHEDLRSMDYALTGDDASLNEISSQKAIAVFRKRLKTLFMLLHPDRLLHVPLTENQRHELRRIWDDCQAVNVKNACHYHLARSSELIESCIDRANAILAQAGIDIDPGLIIQGATLEERIVWLQKAIHRTQRDIEILRDELKAWRDDKEIAAMAALLSQSTEQQRAQHSEMRVRARELTARAESAESELSERLASRSAA